MFAAVLCLAVASSARADNWSKTYTTSGHAQLRFYTQDGAVDLTGSPDKNVSVTVETIGWRIDGSEVSITEHQTGDAVDVEIHIPHWFKSNWFGTSHRSIHITIHVPTTSDIDVHTSDGHINATGVNGESRLDTGDGTIRADHFHGNVRLHTGDGRIEGFDFEGTLVADTGDGHVNVRGRFDRLDVHTGDGTIEAAAESGSKMTGPWTLRSGDGHIYMRLPENFAANVDAHTGDGRVNFTFPVTISGTVDRGTIRGKMGTGGETLTLRSGDGSISIDRI
jgi:DUF4097 and DUF4098 domain-containing protein YvlB